MGDDSEIFLRLENIKQLTEQHSLLMFSLLKVRKEGCDYCVLTLILSQRGSSSFSL